MFHSTAIIALFYFLAFASTVQATDVPACPSVCGPAPLTTRICRKKPGCKLIECEIKRGSHSKNGLSCVSDELPTPAACPNRCIDPRWAEEKCKDLPHCQVMPCDRDVKGVVKPGAKCAPTPAPLACPEKCIDPRWADEKCAMLSHCEVVPCTRDVKGTGTLRPGGMCTAKTPKCPDCGPGKYLVSGLPDCKCSDNPCDACPDGTTCSLKVDADGTETHFCRRCDCGFCDASGNPCCRINPSGVNCVPDNDSERKECKVGQFELGEFNNSEQADICAGEEKMGGDSADDIIDSCGCVPSRLELCNLPAPTGDTCFILRE